jgi:4-hydroxybenzoate polyprenyltransferase
MLCGIIFVTMLAIVGYLNGQGYAYFVISVGGTAAHVTWQFMTVDLDVPHSCWREPSVIYISANVILIYCR